MQWLSMPEEMPDQGGTAMRTRTHETRGWVGLCGVAVRQVSREEEVVAGRTE
jgi:hypothetical protein